MQVNRESDVGRVSHRPSHAEVFSAVHSTQVPALQALRPAMCEQPVSPSKLHGTQTPSLQIDAAGSTQSSLLVQATHRPSWQVPESPQSGSEQQSNVQASPAASALAGLLLASLNRLIAASSGTEASVDASPWIGAASAPTEVVLSCSESSVDSRLGRSASVIGTTQPVSNPPTLTGATMPIEASLDWYSDASRSLAVGVVAPPSQLSACSQ